MRFHYLSRFRRDLNSLPTSIRKKFEKQALYLLRDLRHPSLRAKKYDETLGVWQARVDDDIRFYFLIEGEVYILLEIKKHPK